MRLKKTPVWFDITVGIAILFGMAYFLFNFYKSDPKIDRAKELVGANVAAYDSALGKPYKVFTHADISRLPPGERIVNGFAEPPLRGFHTMRIYGGKIAMICVYFSERGTASDVVTIWP